jgi:hypothetical protein
VRDDLESDPAIQTHRRVPDVGAETHPRHDLDKPAAKRSADASASPSLPHGHREFRRVVVDMAVSTILAPKEAYPGCTNRVTRHFGNETHVTRRGPEAPRVACDLRGIENGPREGCTPRWDEQRLVEHLEQETFVVSGGRANRDHGPQRLPIRLAHDS